MKKSSRRLKVVKNLVIELINSIFCAIVGCIQPAMTAQFEYSNSLACKLTLIYLKGTSCQSSKSSKIWKKMVLRAKHIIFCGKKIIISSLIGPLIN